MPIWLRKFTFHEINEFNISQNAKSKKQSEGDKSSLVNHQGQVNRPKFKNTTSYK
jgi:hypothetical protein